MSKRHYQPQDPQVWLDQVIKLRGSGDIESIKQAINLYDSKNQPLLIKGLGIADILLDLGLDNEALAAALAYPVLQAQEISLDSITESLGEASRRMLKDVLQMQSLGKMQSMQQRGNHQIENLRKMLLAMVTDVRAVLVVLAERLLDLRLAKNSTEEDKKRLAEETSAVYSPLANRLGVWQLKWEIEDLCLRYMQPEDYSTIAKSLASRRDEREVYIQELIQILDSVLSGGGIKHFQITGRVKHIYSIFRKMQRKNADIEKIYDMSAVRVLVDSIEDCYAVLSVLQSHWQQIQEEFDDYISHPKPNGYRSIHTVIIGPKDHFVEVQIRTNEMHNESELGVAAHWRYKEGVLQTSNYEAKIALLRQIMAWQKEVVNLGAAHSEPGSQDIFADRVYVFTPMGEIVDLPNGATPLDFAYHIHSEVGHRCRGAKIDGSIVPLTYHLQTGQRVEILTTKQANPSRDWMNPHLGYLNTPRARAKVQHYFRVKDSSEERVTAREILEKECKKLGLLEKLDLHAIAARLHFKSADALLEALSHNEIRIAQIIHQIQPIALPVHPMEPRPGQRDIESNIQIAGINNLLTNVARCCKPLPGDEIIGYITRNRGVTVHRRDCANVMHITDEQQNRIIDVNWGVKAEGNYNADLLVRMMGKSGLLRDITTILNSEKINVLGVQTIRTADPTVVDIYLTIEISSRQQLQKAIEILKHLHNVIEVRRR